MTLGMQTPFKTEYKHVRRRFMDSSFVYRLYMLLAIGCVVVIGYFGIFRLFTLVQTKRALISQLEGINSSMETNLTSFTSLQTAVLSDANLTSRIPLFMPETSLVEEYIVQLEEAASASGFLIKHINSSEGKTTDGNSFIAINVRTEGAGNPVDFVMAIERLKRITRVMEISYVLNTHAFIPGDSYMNMSLEIYKAEDTQ